jgi:CCR4-NOT transcription complex subunit 3
MEEFEADLEILMNKKSLSGDDKDRMAWTRTQQERHQWHTKKLELILRALDNDAVDVTDLAIVRESVEVYIDMYQDPDYPHDETLYDCFDLAAFEEAAKPRTPSMDVAKDGGV